MTACIIYIRGCKANNYRFDGIMLMNSEINVGLMNAEDMTQVFKI